MQFVLYAGILIFSVMCWTQEKVQYKIIEWNSHVNIESFSLYPKDPRPCGRTTQDHEAERPKTEMKCSISLGIKKCIHDRCNDKLQIRYTGLLTATLRKRAD